MVKSYGERVFMGIDSDESEFDSESDDENGEQKNEIQIPDIQIEE